MSPRKGVARRARTRAALSERRQSAGIAPRSVWIQELTWEDVAEYLTHDDIVLFPIGATEQHGPAGPLGVDSFVCNYLAEDVALRFSHITLSPYRVGSGVSSSSRED